MKANSNQAVLRTLARLGAGADVVSEGELRRALAAGIPADKIVFSGVGKTAREMAFALDAGILCFNVESEPELELLSARRRGTGKTAPVSLAHQSRRRRQDPRARSPPARPRTSSASPGSAPAQSMPARRSCRASRSPASTCISAARSPSCSPSTTPSRCSPNWSARCAPTATRIEHVDLGGGLGIPYRDDDEPPPLPDAYAEIVRSTSRRLGLQADLRAGPADRRQCRHPGRRR